MEKKIIDKKSIKKEAWNIMKNNLGIFWQAYGFILILGLASSELASTLTEKYNVCIFSSKLLNECIITKGDIISIPISLIISLFTTFLTFGIYKILLSVVRKESTSFNDIFSYKKDFLKLFLTSILISIICDIGLAFLIVPGIVFLLMYSQVYFINVDKELKIFELLKESRNLMKGYKFDFLKFQLSFIGWILLTILSLGILIIFVGPYLMFAETLYYEELKKIKSN